MEGMGDGVFGREGDGGGGRRERNGVEWSDVVGWSIELLCGDIVVLLFSGDNLCGDMLLWRQMLSCGDILYGDSCLEQFFQHLCGDKSFCGNRVALEQYLCGYISCGDRGALVPFLCGYISCGDRILLPPYPNSLIEGFNACLQEAELYDLELTGHQFTWEKGRNTSHWTEIRLDRVLANSQWLSLFALAKVYNLEGSPSDHSPLLLCPERHVRGNKKRSFRFENVWLTESMCFQIIKDCWEDEEDKQTQGDVVLNCITQTVSEQQNRFLLEAVTDEEVKNAVFHMHPDKAPGPDGMTPAFFQKNWKVVGKDVVLMVRKFFTTGVLMDNINSTNIVLIPKKKNPSRLTELRPIALCNVIIKIITKVIANRLKHVLDCVISDTQSAFLPGRLITDNVMISFEVMHYLKKKKFGKDGFMALKLDMSKAYDRIEWKFLQDILLKMGFDSWWIHLILQCVSTVDYTIVHGEFEMGPIKPSRGLRQGDPLSPYLFIICAEGLSAMTRYYEAKTWLHGIRICRRAPTISHMLFADDSYLYCKAETGEALKVMELLNYYERASGQRINRDKSTVFFSANVISYNKESVCQVLRIPEADDKARYLGLPNILGRNKTVIFGYLKDRVNASIQKWNAKCVSKPAKEILIKTVAQTLPSYAMNVFLLPLELTREMEKAMSRFYWNSSQESSSKITWMSWDRLTRHKHAGGLGFKCLRDVNLSMLGKQCWRLITNPDSLVARVYKAKYYANTSFMEAKLGSSPSFIWRSIAEARRVISAGSNWRIGTGKEITILGQPWLNNVENPFTSTVSPALTNQTVFSLFCTGTKDWDMDVINDIFDDRDKLCIVNTRVEQDLDKDILCWRLENSGQYSVKTAYKLLQEQKGAWPAAGNSVFWKKIWNIKAPPKALNSVWRAISYCLLTKTVLQTKHVALDNICPVCNEEPETIFHSLVQCKSAALCWQVYNARIITNVTMEFPEWLESNLLAQLAHTNAKIITLCWSIWRARNDLVWRNKRWSPMKIVAKAWEYLSQWMLTQNRFHVITADAAIFEDQEASGIGLIARDHYGRLLLAKTRCYREVMQPSLVEAIAIKEALSWAKNWSDTAVTIESDCLAVVQLIRSATPMRSRLGQVVMECRELIYELNNVKLYFIKRSVNMSAHELAHVAHMYPNRIFDWGSVPIVVKNCILNELSE
ncbi:uncharacterized protein LOC141714732 [Apium graveolens]|uniref:uncharacterized protein LOC141714732 n=1 Tax=Apium graveolens TaxID=4045 RepID=UPI003D7B62D7